VTRLDEIREIDEHGVKQRDRRIELGVGSNERQRVVVAV